MIYSCFISNNFLIKNHLFLFRKLLICQLYSYKHFLRGGFVFNFFPIIIVPDYLFLNIFDFRFLCLNKFSFFTLGLNELNFFIFINVCLRCNNLNFILRKKCFFLCLPLMDLGCTYLINGISRVVVSQLSKFKDFLVYKDVDSNICMRFSPLIGPVVIFLIKPNRRVYVKIFKYRFKIIHIFLIFGFRILDLISIFSVYSILIFLNNKVFIRVRMLDFLGKNISFDLYNDVFSVILKSGSYIDYVFVNLYDYCYFMYSFPNWPYIIIGKSYSINGILFKKNTRLNFNKYFFLFSGYCFVFKIYDINSLINKFLINLLSYNDFGLSGSIITRFLLCFNIKGNFNSFSNLYDITFGDINKCLITSKLKNILIDLSGYCFNDFLFRREYFLGIFKYILSNEFLKIDFIDIDSLENKKYNAIGSLLLIILKKYIGVYSGYMIKRFINLFVSIDWDFLINNNLLTLCLREFFCVSPLSQFLDQINHLSDITHKRRVTHFDAFSDRCLINSAIRNINFSYLGRLCPIETPEGRNIGIVNSLSSMVNIDDNGDLLSFCLYFNNSKYLKLIKLSVFDEQKIFIFDSCVYNKFNFYVKIKNRYLCRKGFFYRYKYLSKFYYIYLSSIQMFSVAPLMIPFMEHNDGNRVLMGANMQRQAVCCISLSIPYISTGVENLISFNLGVCDLVDSGLKLLFYDSFLVLFCFNIRSIFCFKLFFLKKFLSSNQGIFNNHRPNLLSNFLNSNKLIVNDTNNTLDGFLCLGQNLLTVFMPWRGYNFEDAIVISERVAKSDRFCSLHIYTYEVVLNKSLYGEDIIAARNELKNYKVNNSIIDVNGVVKVGSYVNHNDVLVYKFSPKKSCIPFTGYDKLRERLFKNDLLNYKCQFFSLPVNVSGVVINITFWSKNKIDVFSGNNFFLNINCFYFSILCKIFFLKIKKLLSVLNFSFNIIFFLGNFFLYNNLFPKNLLIYYKIILFNNRILYYSNFFKIKFNVFNFTCCSYNNYCLNKCYKKSLVCIGKIFITIASKKYLCIGDKMSGRYGNKGVVSKIVPVEDMPYLSDGTPLELILNPIGVVSRMNLGQLYELKLGMFVFFMFKRINYFLFYFGLKYVFKFLKLIGFSHEFKKLNFNVSDFKKKFTFSSIPFDGLNIFNINYYLNTVLSNGLNLKYLVDYDNDKIFLFDGVTGGRINNRVSFGYLYFLKLFHMSCDKIHSRSIGPYSIITQQPLKGKSNFGGQRFGEMEVWALEAYGSAYILQEMMTVKSDDVIGRNKLYKNILFGGYSYTYNIPESFKMLLCEIRAFGIGIELF